MQHRILLIEDEESLNRGITLKLTREGYIIDSACTLKQAGHLLKEHQPDLIICDIGLPDGSGLDFCKKIRQKSNVLLLFLTALDTELDIVTGYDAGADDYMTKPFSLMVLLSKVNAMLKRTEKEKEEVQELSSGDIRLNPLTCSVYKGTEPVMLTPNEFKLLSLFMGYPRQILSKNRLLDAIWNADSEFMDDNAVAVNIRRLREKIEQEPSHPEYIKNIRGMGYLWDKECGK